MNDNSRVAPLDRSMLDGANGTLATAFMGFGHQQQAAEAGPGGTAGRLKNPARSTCPNWTRPDPCRMVAVGFCPSCGNGFCVLHEAYDFVPNLTPGTFEITSARLGWCQRCFEKLGPEGRTRLTGVR